MHIQLNHEEMIGARKVLLSSEINILKVIQKMRNYSILRKQETALKTKLKAKLRQLNVLLNKITTEMPKLEGKYAQKAKEFGKQETALKTKHKESIAEKAKKATLESEIIDIKRKLELLEQ